MAEESKDVAAAGNKALANALSWLKIVDSWSIGGWQNKFPRLYYVVAVLVLLFFIV
jgi:hypothetical protein